MVPSYKDTEWQVVKRNDSTVVQIRVNENEAWKDYWVPEDENNLDYIRYQEWLAEGNEPRIIF